MKQTAHSQVVLTAGESCGGSRVKQSLPYRWGTMRAMLNFSCWFFIGIFLIRSLPISIYWLNRSSLFRHSKAISQLLVTSCSCISFYVAKSSWVQACLILSRGSQLLENRYFLNTFHFNTKSSSCFKKDPHNIVHSKAKIKTFLKIFV